VEFKITCDFDCKVSDFYDNSDASLLIKEELNKVLKELCFAEEVKINRVHVANLNSKMDNKNREAGNANS